MAEKLSIKIALEGGKEIERQLASIGDAGKKAFMEIAKEAEKVGGFQNIKPEVVTQKLKDLGVAGKDAFDKIQTAVRSASRLETVVGAVAGVESAFGKLGGAALAVGRVLGPVGLAVGVLGSKLNGLVADVEKSILSLDKLAAAGGGSVEKLDALRRAAGQAGLSGKDFATAIESLNKAQEKLKTDQIKKWADEVARARQVGVELPTTMAELTKAARSTDEAVSKAAQAALRSLGVWTEFKTVQQQAKESTEASANASKSSGNQFLDYARKVAEAKTFTEQLKIAQTLLPDANRATVMSLTALANEYEAVRKQMAAFSEQEAIASAKGEIAAQRHANALQELKNTIGRLFLGDATISDWATSAITAIDKFIQRAVPQMKSFWESVKPAGGIDQEVVTVFNKMTAALQAHREASIREFQTLIDKAKEYLGLLTKVLTQSPDTSGAGVPQGVPLMGQPSRFDQLPQSPNIEDRRGEGQIDGIRTSAQEALQAIQEFAASVAEVINTTLSTLATSAQSSAQQIAATFTTAGAQIGQAFQSGLSQLGAMLTSVPWDVFQSAGTTAAETIRASIDGIISSIQNLIANINQAIASLAQLQQMQAAGGGGGAPYAGGGYTGAGGRNTPAGIVHRGEYVQPARVVGRPGVLAFMEMLRRTGDLQTTIMRFARGFDAGGLVNGLSRSLALPGFAAGGMVPAGGGTSRNLGTLRLSLPDGTTRQVQADEDTVLAIERVIRRRDAHSAGRKPSWY